MASDSPKPQTRTPQPNRTILSYFGRLDTASPGVAAHTDTPSPLSAPTSASDPATAYTNDPSPQQTETPFQVGGWTAVNNPNIPPVLIQSVDQNNTMDLSSVSDRVSNPWFIPTSGLTDAQIFAGTNEQLKGLPLVQIAMTHTNKEIIAIWNAQHPTTPLSDQQISRKITEANRKVAVELGRTGDEVRTELERIKSRNGTTARKNATAGTVRHKKKAAAGATDGNDDQAAPMNDAEGAGSSDVAGQTGRDGGDASARKPPAHDQAGNGPSNNGNGSSGNAGDGGQSSGAEEAEAPLTEEEEELAILRAEAESLIAMARPDVLTNVQLLRVAAVFTNHEMVVNFNVQHGERTSNDARISHLLRIAYAADQSRRKADVKAELEQNRARYGTTARKVRYAAEQRVKKSAARQAAGRQSVGNGCGGYGAYEYDRDGFVTYHGPVEQGRDATRSKEQGKKPARQVVNDSEEEIDSDENPLQDLEDAVARDDLPITRSPLLPHPNHQVGYLAGMPGYISRSRAYTDSGQHILGPASTRSDRLAGREELRLRSPVGSDTSAEKYAAPLSGTAAATLAAFREFMSDGDGNNRFLFRRDEEDATDLAAAGDGMEDVRNGGQPGGAQDEDEEMGDS